MAKYALGSEPVVGSLTPLKKREYKVTNRLQEGKRPLYAVVFNFIDSRYFNVFATVGGNRVSCLYLPNPSTISRRCSIFQAFGFQFPYWCFQFVGFRDMFECCVNFVCVLISRIFIFNCDACDICSFCALVWPTQRSWV